MEQNISFSLYDEMKSKGQCQVNWNTLCPTINKLKIDHTEIIYAMILHHYIINDFGQSPNTKTSVTPTTIKRNKIISTSYNISSPNLFNSDPSQTIPYNGKLCEGGKGIIYKLEDLPKELQYIISNYILSLVNPN